LDIKIKEVREKIKIMKDTKLLYTVSEAKMNFLHNFTLVDVLGFGG